MSDSPLPDDVALYRPPTVRAFAAGQRRALAAALIAFIASLTIMLVRNPVHVADPIPSNSPRFDELADKLDPNTADVASLAALPQLGARRARDIVDYRERARAGEPSGVVFRSIDDLLRVRGIGYAMSRQAEPFLSFPATRPTN